MKDNADIMPQKKGSGGSRRSFFKFIGLGGAVAVAPTVKAVEVLPEHESEKFAGGFATRPVDFGGMLSRMVDVQDATAYDRVRLKAGRVPMRLFFFQTPVGQTCPYSGLVKTWTDTSMCSSGCLSAPYELLVHRVLFAVHPSADQRDLDQLTAVCSWEFQLLQKIMHRGTLLLNAPARVELTEMVNPEETRPDSHDTRLTLGLPDEVRASAHTSRTTGGVLIPSMAYFAVKIECAQDVHLYSDLDLLIGLQGLECWAVQ